MWFWWFFLRTFGAAATATWHSIYDVKGKLAGEVLLEGRVETTQAGANGGGAGNSAARCVCVVCCACA